MKRLLYILPLFLSVKSYAGSGGANDEAIFIAYIIGFLLLIIALLETSRTIRKIRRYLIEKKRLKQERLEAERHNEENHYFTSTNYESLRLRIYE